jgi:hypothetical protein
MSARLDILLAKLQSSVRGDLHHLITTLASHLWAFSGVVFSFAWFAMKMSIRFQHRRRTSAWGGTRHKRASLLSCVGEPLKCSVRCFSLIAGVQLLICEENCE